MAGFGLLWIVILAALVLLVAGVVRKTGAAGSQPPPRGINGADSAEEILRQCFARGEIDSNEYESRLRELRR